MAHLITRSIHFADESADDHIRRARQMLVRNGHSPDVGFESPEGEVEARVEHGRWIADCPAPDCGGAEFVDPDWAIFVCASCGGVVARVRFPSAKQRAEIAGALLERARAENRNWNPGETAASLRAENRAHGIGG